MSEEAELGQPSGLVADGAAVAPTPAPAQAAAQPDMGAILRGLATVMENMITAQKQQSEAIVNAIHGRKGTVEELTMPIALRKLQERSPEFPTYDSNAEKFMWWLATVEERRKLRGIPDKVAITFVTEALGSNSRGVITGEQKWPKWE